MNIVFAYHAGDVWLALESAKAITAMGINIRHKAYICVTNNTPKISEITEELKKSFPEVGRIVAQEGFNGWPLGPNQMFSDVASALYPTNMPFMFWEPDCVPMKEGWIDDLETEFKKRPSIMGHVYHGGVASNGKNIYNMIVGCAVYPSNFLDYCPAAQSLGNYNLAYRSSGNTPEPWDVRCRHNFLKIGRDSQLIRTYWKSCNYRWSDGKIVFSASDPEALAVQKITCPEGFISSAAVVIHGCKDGSLHKLAQNKFEDNASEIIDVYDPTKEPAVITHSKHDQSEAEAFLQKLRMTAQKPNKPPQKKKSAKRVNKKPKVASKI